MIGADKLKIIKQNIKRDLPIRLNIHLTLKKSLVDWAVNANKLLNQGIDADIQFGENSLMQPHISLIMGNIKKASRIEELIKRLSRLFSNQTKLNLEFDSISSSENKHWAFLWVKDNPELSDLINTIEIIAKDLIDIEFKSVPHLSITRSNQFAKNITLLNKLSLPKNQTIDTISVGLCGNEGTVLETIKSFKLK